MKECEDCKVYLFSCHHKQKLCKPCARKRIKAGQNNAVKKYRKNSFVIKINKVGYKVKTTPQSNGMFMAKVDSIPGCYTEGKDLKEVKKRIREAIEVCLEASRTESKAQA